MSSTDFDEAMTQAKAALHQIVNGDASGYKALFSRREDVTLANPFGGIGRGWDGVVEQLDRAASHYRDGRVTAIETINRVVSGDFAYTVEIERVAARVGGRPEVGDFAVRVTCVYRREAEGWKLVHRHADPRVSRQPAESVVSG